MKKTLFKNFYRTIFRTFPKFVSIVFMIALGVMVFVGLKITPYIMRGSVDERVKEGNLYDYKISSNFGLQKEDENIISNLKNLKDVEYGYSINLKDEDRKVDFTIENKPEKISTVQVVEGKDIESDSDILLDERLKDKYKIGDEIDFKNVEKFGIFKDEVKKLKQSKITSWDVSEKALDIARRNKLLNQVDITLAQVDIFDTALPDIHVDVLVSNPPYITEKERSGMERNVLDWEPELALFVPDSDPLLFYRRIAEVGCDILVSGGTLYYEINRAYGKETVQLLEGMGYQSVELRKDMFGNDRMIKAFRP